MSLLVFFNVYVHENCHAHMLIKIKMKLQAEGAMLQEAQAK